MTLPGAGGDPPVWLQALALVVYAVVLVLGLGVLVKVLG